MNEPDLRALLRRVHEELRSADTGDPATRDLVQRVGADLRPMLDAAPGTPRAGNYEALTGRLREAAIHFEASHPALARTLEGVIDTLGSYGI